MVKHVKVFSLSCSCPGSVAHEAAVFYRLQGLVFVCRDSGHLIPGRKSRVAFCVKEFFTVVAA